MSDYTIHHDIDRKERYYKRMKERRITVKTRPKFWAHNILWNKPSI
jgi:hypothetical protein